MGDQQAATASPDGRRGGRPRRATPGLLLVWLVVGVNLAALGVASAFVLHDRAQARASAAVATQNVAQLLDEALSAAFDRVDLALLAVKDALEERRGAAPGGAGLDEVLARQRARTPDLLALRVLDPAGLVVHSAPALPAPVSMGARPEFEALRRGAASAVSRPTYGTISKAPVIVFARRVAAADGSFGGAVEAVIDLQHVVDIISRPDMGPHGAIALRAEDLSLVARTGPGGATAALSQTAVSAQMQAARGRREATFDALAPADGVARTYSFRWLAHHPFYVVAGLAHRDTLAAWRRTTLFAALLLAAFVALTSLGAWLAHQAWRRQRRAEGELARLQRIESLAVLAGGIAHDFNNLLTGIAGNVSLAREASPPGSLVAESLADAEAASKRAGALAHQLLTFARGGAPVKRRVDLSALVEEAARFAAHGAGTALQLTAAPRLEVEVDPGQLGQVVQNLVLNGIQAMGSRGTLAVRIARETVAAGDARGWRPGPWAVISVEDRGPGVPPEVLPHIFDPFFTTKVTGKGLGLAISHSIVEKHEGHLEVVSPPSGGATFRVWLPAAEGVAPAAAAAAPAPAALPPARRILVMDDEEAVRRLVVRLLAPAGYEVVEARDGEEAVARHAEAQAAGRPFAAVLMDLTIPGGVGGLEALGRLRQRDPQVAVVVCSGYSNDPVLARWAEHGFQAALGKPYVAGELREALARVLGHAGAAS